MATQWLLVTGYEGRLLFPRLIESVDLKHLQAVSPTLISNRLGQEHFMASHGPDCLDLHFADSQREFRHGQPECSRTRYGKGNLTPIDKRFFMILAEFKS